jgi:hypothetical protein
MSKANSGFLKSRIDIKRHADLRIVLEAGKRVN